MFLEDRSLQIGAKKRKKTLEHKSQEKTQSEARLFLEGGVAMGSLGASMPGSPLPLPRRRGNTRSPRAFTFGGEQKKERKIGRKTPSSACFRHTQTLEQTLVCAIDSCKLLSYV